jgi:hypothetical protein
LFVSLLAAAKKRRKAKNALEDVALVAGTSQNLSNLYSLDIYECAHQVDACMVNIGLVQKVLSLTNALAYYITGFGII